MLLLLLHVTCIDELSLHFLLEFALHLLELLKDLMVVAMMVLMYLVVVAMMVVVGVSRIHRSPSRPTAASLIFMTILYNVS